MRTSPRSTKAFSLVEVTLAIGVAGFCLLAIFGLLPVGINTNKMTVEQTTAANISRSIAADLRNTPRVSPPAVQTSPAFKLTVPGTTADAPMIHSVFFNEGGQIVGSQDANADPNQHPAFRATLVYLPPTSTTIKAATGVRILVTWPALADRTATTNALPKNYSGAFDAFTALDRN